MEEFSRTEMLLGADALNKLKNSRIAIFGIGGVGGFVVESLARSGVGALDVIDRDKVCLSNINRQIIATHETLGQLKVDAIENRIHQINPNCHVRKYPLFYLPETSHIFDFTQYDYIVDAVDTISAKIDIISKAKKSNISIISAMGAGNKLDPTAFEVADITQTSVCPLARVVRRELKKRGINHVKVVFSKEKPITLKKDAILTENNKHIPGSISFVPSVEGLIIGGEVIKDLTRSYTTTT